MIGPALLLALAWQDPQVEAMAERVRRLRRAVSVARAAEEAVRAREAPSWTDTVAVGGLRMVTLRGAGEATRPHLERAAAQLAGRWGDLSPILREEPLRLAYRGSAWSFDRLVEVQALNRVAERAGRRVQRWVQFPRMDDEPWLFIRAHVDLVTAAPGVATHCYLGDLDACVLALGLVVPDDPALTLWDSAGRREMVRRTRWPHQHANLAHECVSAPSDAACTRLLRRLPDARAPLGVPSRQALLRTLATVGGDQAIVRLVRDSSENLADRFAAAAAVPLDTLLTAWRASLLAHRPPAALSGSVRLRSVLWILAFTALALRGTRWRLG